MANTIVYQAEWGLKLVERLKKPTNWKETCDVLYTDTQVYTLPYVGSSSESAFQTGLTRGNTYTFQDITETTQSLSITTFDILSELLDRADEAQSNYAKRMDRAALQGAKLNERVQAIVQANHTAWTDFGDTGGGALGLSSSAITVSSNNVDDIVRCVIEQIQTANGFDLYRENGGFIEWKPAEWNYMVQFMQSNGFIWSDHFLKNGGQIGIYYLGLYHYVTNPVTALHSFAGVRKIQTIGILKSTYGKIYITEDPAGASGGNISGIGVNTRLDYGLIVRAVQKPLVFDVNTAV